MQTERTTKQRLDRCALLKSYETQAFQLANSKLATLYSGIADHTPMQMVEFVSKTWEEYNKQLGELFGERDTAIKEFDEDCDQVNLQAAKDRSPLEQAMENVREFGKAVNKMGVKASDFSDYYSSCRIEVPPTPVGYLDHPYTTSKFAVYEPIGWFKRLMLRWCFGLKYEPVEKKED